MGHDKASLPFGPESLVARVIRLVRDEVDEVVLAAGAGQVVPAGPRVLRDSREGLGPLPALVAAAAAVDREYAFVVACDTPLLQPPLVRLLIDHAQGWDACVPVVNDVLMPTCAVYRVRAVRMAGGAVLDGGGTSLRALLTALRTRCLDESLLRQADPSLLSFTPCNTPGEYRRALALAGLSVNGPAAPAV